MDERGDMMNAAMERAGRKWTEETSGQMRADLAAAVRRRLRENEARQSASGGAAVVSVGAGEDAAAPRRAALPRRLPAALAWSAMAAAAVAIAAIAVSALRGPSPIGTVSFGSGSFASAQSRELHAGARLECGADGRGLALLDGQRVNVYMNSGTSMTIESRAAIRLTAGEIWTRVEPGSGDFEVLTPHGKVEVHGTSFGVAVTNAGTAVSIATGVIEVGVGENCTEMRPGQSAFVAAGAAAPAFSPAAGDATPSWALALYQQASAANASLYLPSGALPAK